MKTAVSERAEASTRSAPRTAAGRFRSRSAAPAEPRPAPRTVTRKEQVERLKVMTYLVTHGMSEQVVEHEMRERFGMSRKGVVKLRARVDEQLADVDRELLPQMKRRQIARLQREIQQAAASGSWTAVASLETVLAKVTGTFEPVSVNVNVDATVREAVTAVLADMGPERLEALVTTGELVAESPPALPDSQPLQGAPPDAAE